MKVFKIILLSAFLMGMTSVLTYSETNFYLFGSGNFFRSAESDYEEGVIDFSIMSSHTTYGIGFGIVQTSKGVFFIGIEGHYNLSGKTDLTDPSDDDTVNINTYKNIAGYLTLGFNIVNSERFSFFINGGGGVNYISDAKEETYTSTMGYETIIEPPEKKYCFAGFGGVGFVVRLSETVGIFLNGRYLFISYEEPAESAIVGLAGFHFKF